MSKGIYERQEKNGDAVYCLRYQVDGKDFKERAERKPRSLSRKLRKQTGGRSPALICFSLIFSVATFISSAVFAQQEPVTIDLINATLNSNEIFKMVVDDVTSALGRPSAVDDKRLFAGIIGPQVDYHPLGLSFWFDAKKIDSGQKLLEMKIYLASFCRETRNLLLNQRILHFFSFFS
ncbi:MAG: hypothetical protein Q8S00_12855 [Deltaproteobacteria bacterium]|nr:hypothetical protein [Deltaproteobacteria bacterium]